MNRQWTSRKGVIELPPQLRSGCTERTRYMDYDHYPFYSASMAVSFTCYILLPLVVMRGLENWSAKALALGCRFANITILGTLPVVVSLAILVVCLGRGTFSTKECWVFSALLAVSRGKPFVEFLSSLFCSQCFNTFGSWVLCWVRSAWLPNSI